MGNTASIINAGKSDQTRKLKPSHVVKDVPRLGSVTVHISSAVNNQNPVSEDTQASGNESSHIVYSRGGLLCGDTCDHLGVSSALAKAVYPENGNSLNNNRIVDPQKIALRHDTRKHNLLVCPVVDESAQDKGSNNFAGWCAAASSEVFSRQ